MDIDGATVAFYKSHLVSAESKVHLTDIRWQQNKHFIILPIDGANFHLKFYKNDVIIE